MDQDEMIRGAEQRLSGARRLMAEAETDAERAEAVAAVRLAQADLDALMEGSGWRA